MVLPLVAPVVAVRALVWHPLTTGAAIPMVYLTGLYAMAVAYGLCYLAVRRRYDALWFYGIGFCVFYAGCLVWQTYWAIVTSRSSSWGTRPATAGSTR
jgi:hyaluronan synthase